MSVYSTYLTNSLIAKKSFEIILLFLLMEKDFEKILNWIFQRMLQLQREKD